MCETQMEASQLQRRNLMRNSVKRPTKMEIPKIIFERALSMESPKTLPINKTNPANERSD